MDVLAAADRLIAPFVAPPRCAACDALVAAAAVFCGACAAGVDGPPPLPAGLWAPFLYGGPVAEAVVRFKYGGRVELGTALGGLLARRIPPALAVDLVVPVPLHPRRLVERGFNQAALLARPVARARSVAFAPRGLARVRDTPRQAHLARAERIANVRAAFVVRHTDLVAGRRVLLIDDVMTTGSTVGACTAALLAAGARDVTTATLAIALAEAPS